MSGGVSGGALRGGGGSGQPNGATTAPNGGVSTGGVVRAASGVTKPEGDVYWLNSTGDDEQLGHLALTAASVGGNALAVDPAAGNTLAWGAAGLYVPPAPAAVIPPEYLTEAEGDARYAPLGGGSADVAITGDDGIGVVESPANTFALTTRVSGSAGNTLVLQSGGLYVPATPLPAHDHTAADGGALTNEEHDGFSQYANLGADPAQPATNRIRLYAKDNGAGVATLYYRTEDGTIYELPTLATGGGGGGSGAPATASYITTAAETKLTGERVLGTAVIMSGVLSGRPAPGTAGRLFLATDTDLVYRDTGSTWETFATRSTAGGGWLPTTGGTLTGALVLQGASSTANVLGAKLASDANNRFQVDASGKLEWGSGSGAPTKSLAGNAVAGALSLNTDLYPLASVTSDLGSTTLLWRQFYARDVNAYSDAGFVRVGASAWATAGAVRLKNTAVLGWRNAGDTANNTLAWGASDRFALSWGATEKVGVAANGTLTLTPDVGQNAVVATLGGGQYVVAPGAANANNARLYSLLNLELNPAGGIAQPSVDNAVALGHPSYRWTYVAAVAGTINTSAAAAKTDIAPLDPAAALAAVLATDPVVFDYTPPVRDAAWYELPDDPEQAEALLYQRLTTEPLMEAARHQAGFVLQDGTGAYQTDPLFETGTGQSNAANTAGVLIAALHEVARRLSALEGN